MGKLSERIVTFAVAFVIGIGAIPLFTHANPLSRPVERVDLTHSFDASTFYWPTSKPFQWEKEAWGRDGGFWYTAGRYAASEHGGTHIDAPIHFAEGGATVDAIPLDRLFAKAFVIDITDKARKNPDAVLTTGDIAEWEGRYGRIEQGSVVFVRTGWSEFWGDRKRYFGTDVPLDVANLHFPGIAEEAARFLANERHVAGVGIDTASLDPGTSKNFIAHQLLTGGGIYGLENVANLDRLPPRGSNVIVLPMKIGGGTGAPVRIVATLPQ